MSGGGPTLAAPGERALAAMIEKVERRYRGEGAAKRGDSAEWVLAIEDDLDVVVSILPGSDELLLKSDLGPPSAITPQRSLEMMARISGLPDQTGGMALSLGAEDNVRLAAAVETVELDEAALEWIVSDFGSRCFAIQRILADADPDDEEDDDPAEAEGGPEEFSIKV